MANKNRLSKINEIIKQELSHLIRFDLKDPRISELVSVLKVDTTGDLRYAKVFMSIYDSKEKQNQVIDILSKASGYLRKNVGQKLKTHYTPQLLFVLDDSIEYGVHIDEVLRKIKKDEKTTEKVSENDSE
ncbi:MAG: 30S ribosome-binding factor RbfA [Eubacteriaceae bacterium]|nr:30S ribosome-binding factor RbfA [Eubacteriaceae bacterium]